MVGWVVGGVVSWLEKKVGGVVSWLEGCLEGLLVG